MKSNDSATWSQLAKFDSLEQLVNAYKNPGQFQIELAELLQHYGRDFASPTVIEVGSANGITTALLPTSYAKTLLDFSSLALEQAKMLFAHLGQGVELIEANILSLESAHTQYDIVFSAGLIEHFSLEDRTIIIENMFRLSKPNGYVIIAVPNHHSIPYRLGYLYRVFRGTWPYPREESISSLERETSHNSRFIYIHECDLSKGHIYHFLPPHLKKLFRLLDRWLKFEAYLKVWIYRNVM